MQKPPDSQDYKVVPFPGMPYLQGGLKVASLLEHKDKFVNAQAKFAKAADGVQKGILYAIQKWIGGFPDDKRHHGWKQSQHGGAYTKCYVFKHVAKAVRFYGCLYHPSTDGRVVICCVIHYDEKREDEVDTAILDEINRILQNPSFIKALEKFWEEIQSKQGDTHEV